MPGMTGIGKCVPMLELEVGRLESPSVFTGSDFY